MNKNQKPDRDKNVDQGLPDSPQDNIQNENSVTHSDDNDNVFVGDADDSESAENDSLKSIDSSDNDTSSEADEESANDEADSTNKSDQLNLTQLLKIILKKWWMILLNCLIFGAIAALLIVEEPRTYTSEVKLVPESEDVSTGGTLSSIASSFGINIGDMTSTDAIRPDIYPDLVETNDFIVGLFNLPVKTIDGNIYTDYYTYLKKYQKSSWWGKAIYELKKKMSPPPPENQYADNSGDAKSDSKTKPRLLSREQETMIENIRGLVGCAVDKRTFIITITASDQDPLICATVADSISARIQNIITDYRTSKAKRDYEYYYSLLKQAKKEYDQSCERYAKYVDAHRDVILQVYVTERDQLENDMQLKLNTYNTMLAQTQTAKAKIQESTPAFKIIQHAFVPVKPTGPKRVLFVIGVLFIVLVGTVSVIVVKHLL